MSEGWLAVLPFKGDGQSKTRLQLPQSQTLAQEWLGRAQQACLTCSAIASTWVVTRGPLVDLCPGVQWFRQSGSGLNQGLEEWWQWRRPRRWLVVLPDLPGLTAAGLQGLIRACPAQGLALAPDRHQRGCNGLAVSGVQPRLVFGPSSLQAYRSQPWPQVDFDFPELAHDVDTVEDWEQLPWPQRLN